MNTLQSSVSPSWHPPYTCGSWTAGQLGCPGRKPPQSVCAEAVDVQNHHVLHAQGLRSSKIEEYILAGLRFQEIIVFAGYTHWSPAKGPLKQFHVPAKLSDSSLPFSMLEDKKIEPSSKKKQIMVSTCNLSELFDKLQRVDQNGAQGSVSPQTQGTCWDSCNFFLIYFVIWISLWAIPR